MRRYKHQKRRRQSLHCRDRYYSIMVSQTGRAIAGLKGLIIGLTHCTNWLLSVSIKYTSFRLLATAL
jgi:hypothetical protein